MQTGLEPRTAPLGAGQIHPLPPGVMNWPFCPSNQVPTAGYVLMRWVVVKSCLMGPASGNVFTLV